MTSRSSRTVILSRALLGFSSSFLETFHGPLQGDHLPGNPGNVQEFQSGWSVVAMLESWKLVCVSARRCFVNAMKL